MKYFNRILLLPFLSLVGCHKNISVSESLPLGFKEDPFGNLYNPEWLHKENLFVSKKDELKENDEGIITEPPYPIGSVEWKTEARERKASDPIQFTYGINIGNEPKLRGIKPYVQMCFIYKDSEGKFLDTDSFPIESDLPPYQYNRYDKVGFYSDELDADCTLYNIYGTFRFDFSSIYSKIGDTIDSKFFIKVCFPDAPQDNYTFPETGDEIHGHFRFEDNGGKVIFSHVRFIDEVGW